MIYSSLFAGHRSAARQELQRSKIAAERENGPEGPHALVASRSGSLPFEDALQSGEIPGVSP
jgi:hypothetical protein